MELRLHHIIDHLYNIFIENDGSENSSQLIEEEFNKMIGMNDEHDGNVVSMNSLNIHDVNDMQSYKLGDAMFDEDNIFTPPSFGEQVYYDESMTPIYDYYGDDMYAILNNYTHETSHHDFNFLSHDSYFVEFAPTTIHENKFAYGRVTKLLCLCVMKRMLYVMVILLNFFMMLPKIIMREEHMILHISIISSFLSMCRKF